MTATFLLVLTLSAGPSAPYMMNQPHAEGAQAELTEAQSAGELQLALRDLWAGHIFWVRSYVLSSHYKDERGAGAAEAEVVKNARAIADATEPLYGGEAADQLFQLLAGHYGAIKDYMEAHYRGDEAGQGAASSTLTENADAIATFLASANPHLPKDAVLPLLVAHGGHHVQQINAIHGRDFTGEATIWEAMRTHMNTIADAMADAFVKQFPDKFAS